jgi:membrane associated rhomboid family serine protease
MNDSTSKRIAAHSQRQAMDWSLVLVSQGIESTIDCAEDGSGWGLLVQESDYEAALNSIRLYQLENHRWPWRQQVVKTGLFFDWGSAAWVLLAVLFYALDGRVGLRTIGLMDSSLVAQGQWWRLFTAVWLHADIGHLAANASLGLVLVGLAMGRFGTGAGLLAAYLAGVGGNLAGWLLAAEGPHRSLGASGMVMGALGLIAAQSWTAWRGTLGGPKLAIGGVLGGIMLFVLLGVAPHTDVIAHAGGFLTGLILGAVLHLVPKLADISRAQALAGFLFSVLTIVPWLACMWASRGPLPR